MSDSKLSLEAQKEIRKYMIRIVIPAGAILSILTLIAGYSISSAVNSKTTESILKSITPGLIEASKQSAAAKLESEDLLDQVRDMKQRFEIESRNLSALLAKDSTKQAVADILLKDKTLIQELVIGSNSQLSAKVNQLDLEMREVKSWQQLSMSFKDDFDPACTYRVRVLGLGGGDEAYSSGYSYITTVTPLAMWASWIGNNDIEISKVNNTLKITSGRFKGRDFILERNCISSL